MKIQARLTTFLLACGVVPMTLVGVLDYSIASKEASKLEMVATEELEARARAQLHSVAAARRSDITHYFDTLRTHVVTLAAQHEIHAALDTMSAALPKLAEGIDTNAARQELGQYYRGAFAAEYRRQNQRDTDIEGYLGRLDAVALAAQLTYVQRNPHPLGQKHQLVDTKDGSPYSAAHATLHQGMVPVQQGFGYYDVFLIDDAGRIVYTVFKELDFGTSLTEGPWAQSNLGKLFRTLQATPTGQTAFADFETYAPSYDGPAAFLGTPLVLDGKRHGFLAVQLPIDRINQVASSTEGMGKTGEVLLIGSDHRMRSDSRHQPDTHSVVASFRNPAKGSYSIPQVLDALAGKEGDGFLVDSDGATELAV